ncbi:MAG: hypothetical protein ACFFFY_07310 [Promethearchaeota archaeon]
MEIRNNEYQEVIEKFPEFISFERDKIFKRRRFTKLLAYPYNLSDNLKYFDTSVQKLEHIIIE